MQIAVINLAASASCTTSRVACTSAWKVPLGSFISTLVSASSHLSQ